MTMSCRARVGVPAAVGDNARAVPIRVGVWRAVCIAKDRGGNDCRLSLCESGDAFAERKATIIPAFAGMTGEGARGKPTGLFGSDCGEFGGARILRTNATDEPDGNGRARPIIPRCGRMPRAAWRQADERNLPVRRTNGAGQSMRVRNVKPQRASPAVVHVYAFFLS